MEEKTKIIITPITKCEILIKTWITGKEHEDIQAPITDIKLIMDTGGIGKGEINVGEAQRKSVEKAVEIVVISVGGKKENIVQEVQNLRKEDYLFVLQEVDDVVKGKDFTRPESEQEKATARAV